MLDKENVNSLTYNLIYLTDYILNNVEDENNPFLPKLYINFKSKPIVTKYINKIIFPDEDFFKNENKENEYISLVKSMNEIKQIIFKNIKNDELKKNVLYEIFFYKNQEPLFKFYDKHTKKTSLIYKNNIMYEYFLEDIFNDKNNYIYIKDLIKEIIDNILFYQYNILKSENNKFSLIFDNKFKFCFNNLNIYETTDINDIEENEETKSLFFEIYNFKKKQFLYNLILIFSCLKYKIINFDNIIEIIKFIKDNLKYKIKLSNNFIIKQEINLLSYYFIILKCMFNNTYKKFKLSNKEIKKFNMLYDENFLKQIFSFSNNKYLSFILY